MAALDFALLAEQIAIGAKCGAPLKLRTQGRCPDCGLTMEMDGCEYRCGSCGRAVINEAAAQVCVQAVRAGGAPGGRKRHYGGNTDYAKTQHKAISQYMAACTKSYKGIPIPNDIIAAVVTHYNNIQKTVLEDVYEGDVVSRQKKFVRRTNVKDKILAFILFNECVARGTPRRRRDIAAYIGLAVAGFAIGEAQVRKLVAEGKIDLVICDENALGYAERYLEALGIPEEHSAFIVDLVDATERARILPSLQLSSKVVGCLWVLIRKLSLNVSAAELERATDNTKKNTYAEFVRHIWARKQSFAGIFNVYGVPL